jgi:mannan endo-1,4-beta-mannosidase
MNLLPVRKVICAVWACMVGYALHAHAGQYDFFGGFIPQGTPTIDGTIQNGEWNLKGKVTRSKFYGEDSRIDVYFMWDTNYLYIAAEIQDYELWVDNHIPAQPWVSTLQDDAFKIEVDPNRSRDALLQTSDRVFSTTPTGAGNRFDQGDGAGSTVGATLYGSPTNKWAATYGGILNDYTFKTASDSSKQDKGYTVEIALSWKNIFGSSGATAPVDGYSLGLNPVVLDNDIAGVHDFAYYAAWKRVYDEITGFMGNEGVPLNWAEFVISANSDVAAPAALTNLSVLAHNEYTATLGFTASGDNGWTGYASNYEVRYWTNVVTTSNWNSVSIYTNNFRPKKAGQKEVLKLIGLLPATAYWIGVRPVDEKGNMGGVATVNFSTSATNGSSGRGFITVAPGSRYLAWENGDPFVVIGDVNLATWSHMCRFYNGPLWDQANSVYRNYYQLLGPDYAYLDYLRSNGVNTVRTFAEDYYPTNPMNLSENCSSGASNIVFNTNTLAFLQTYLDALSTRGIGAVITPFDTFYYNSRWADHPLSTAKGGPMATPDDFYNPAHLEYLKAIMRKLVETVGPRKNLVAWEFINEFDSDAVGAGWNHAAFSNRENTVNALADYIRSIDSNHIVLVSSVRWDVRFSTAQAADPAVVLNNDRCQVNSTHMYYHDIRDPNYNNSANPASPYLVWDQDRSVAPMVRVKQGLQYYYANSLTPKPYFDTEYGPLEWSTPAYDAYFSQAEDIQLFHNMIWAHLASGDVGTGIRWPGAVMDDELPDQMRKYQLALSRFAATNLDFPHFNPYQIGQIMTVTNTLIPVVKTGISDGRQGIVFLVKDTRKNALYGDVAGATLKVPGLQPSACYTFEFWDSYNSAATQAASVTNVLLDGGGTATVTVPTFTKTSAIKFYLNAALTASLCPLVVSSPYAGAVPPGGTNVYVINSSVSAGVTNSPVINGTTQYVCRGWIGAGSVPASGASTNTGSFTLTNTSSIVWQWTTNFWLDTATNGNGGVNVGDQWVPKGTNLTVTAVAGAASRFTGWSGQTNGCTISSNQIIVPVNGALLITANFIKQYSFTVGTPFGAGVPGAGTNWYDTGASVTAKLTNSPVSVASTQYVCRGWAGTGSTPASGVTTNAGPFTITNNSSITWLWRTNFWLDVATAGAGSLSTNDCWLSSGSNLLVTATASNHWHFTQWSGDTNGCTIASNKITVAMGYPRTLTASFLIDTQKLIVSTPYGQSAPAAGTNWFNYGSSNSVAITNSPLALNGTQYVCKGWTGTGSIPASGVASNTAVFALTNDSSIVWKWGTNYWLNTSVTGPGSVNVSSNWFVAGTNIVMTATPSNHYHFVKWSGGTNGCTIATNRITVPMSVPRSINAAFEIDTNRLVVTSLFGQSAPPVGTNWFAYGAMTNAALVNAAVTAGGTQYVCRGWTGTGSVPASGISSNTGTFALTNNSTLTWLWTTNYWLDTVANGGGALSVDDGWIPKGSNVLIIATGSNHSYFVRWSGDTNSCTIATNRITAPMTRARSIVANYAPDPVLIVNSDFGVGLPATGTNWCNYNTSVSALVSSATVVNALSQYVCRGWSGTGNVPASGLTTNTGPFTITTNSSVTWLWRTNFWLDVGYAGKGSLSTNDCWLSSGTNLQVTATPSNHWHFSQWVGETNGCTLASNQITVAMNTPRALSAVFSSDQHKLIVATPHGQATPPSGTNWFDYGSSNMVMLTNAPVIIGGTQYVCTGWTGTGSVPGAGATTNTDLFVLTNDSSIVWLWSTNYWLHVDKLGNGELSTNDTWVPQAANLQVTASPAEYYYFGQWQGQTNSAILASNAITVIMNSERSLVAVFSLALATNDVPHWWLAQYGLTNYNVDAMRDVDGSGMLVWMKWVAGCDPTNPASVFRVTAAQGSAGESIVIRWSSNSNRFYDLSRAATLLAETNAFIVLPGASNMPATPVENSYTDSVQGVGPYFYKVDVHE